MDRRGATSGSSSLRPAKGRNRQGIRQQPAFDLSKMQTSECDHSTLQVLTAVSHLMSRVIPPGSDVPDQGLRAEAPRAAWR